MAGWTSPAREPAPVAIGMKSITEQNWHTAPFRTRFAAEIDATPIGNDTDANYRSGRSSEAARARRLVSRLRRARQYAVGLRGAIANRRGPRACSRDSGEEPPRALRPSVAENSDRESIDDRDVQDEAAGQSG